MPGPVQAGGAQGLEILLTEENGRDREIETLQKCSDGLFWFIMFVHINLYAGHVVSDCGLEELKFSDIYLFIISFLLFSYFSNMQ